jgi:hypothetical protein
MLLPKWAIWISEQPEELNVQSGSSYKLVICPDVAKLCPEGKAAPFVRILAIKPLQTQRPTLNKYVLVFSSMAPPCPLALQYRINAEKPHRV